MEYVCYSCKNIFNPTEARIRANIRRGHKTKFCSNKCKFIGMKFEKKEKFNIICKKCGKSFRLLKSEIRGRDTKDICCSWKCAWESRRKRMNIICEQCKKIFAVVLSRKNARFCSYKCEFKWRWNKENNKEVFKICLNCGKKTKTSDLMGGNKKYCSNNCGYYYRKKTGFSIRSKYILKICIICGKNYYVNESMNKKGYNLCSIKCQRKYLGSLNANKRMAKKIERICLYCKEIFYDKIHNKYIHNRKFCNRKCYHLSRIKIKRKNKCD